MPNLNRSGEARVDSDQDNARSIHVAFLLNLSYQSFLQIDLDQTINFLCGEKSNR
jgi:hypothetical protein